MSKTIPSEDTSTQCARSPGRTESTSRPLIPPLELSVVYCLDDLDHVDSVYDGNSSGFIYARDGHPNASQLAEKLAKLEAGEAGLICASGMGAIAGALLTLLGQGDHALISDGIYGRTTALVARQLSRWGISHSLFDPTDPSTAKKELNPRTRVIFVETLTNPLLRVADLAGLASIAREAAIPLVVDNTFAPVICRPLEYGASIVVHSVTKMIGGHSDLTLGAMVGDRRWIDQAKTVASTLGQTGNPFESWLALRGLATLPLRMGRACATALDLATRFETHPTIARVYYPLLSSHPDFDLASRVLSNRGGTIVTIELLTRKNAETFIRSLAPSIPFAPSLGDVQTTLSHPATTSHRGQDDRLLSRQGLSAGTVRISVGLEEPEILWQEFQGALDRLDHS